MSETRNRASHASGRCRASWTTFLRAPCELLGVLGRAESGRILCLSLYSAITANQVFSLDKAKTEKKKKILVLGDKFSFPAFVRLPLCERSGGRERRAVLRE